MKIELHLKPERIEFIQAEFPEAEMSETDNEGFIKISFEINNNWDALKLFHSGIHCGNNCKVSYPDQKVQ